MASPCLKDDEFREINIQIGRLRNNVVWKMGFWIMVTFFTLAVPALVGAIVQNDRLRASEDQRIEGTLFSRFTILNDKLTEISGDVREIKALVKTDARRM